MPADRRQRRQTRSATGSTPSEAKSILLSGSGLRRKAAAATSRPRAIEQVAVRFEAASMPTSLSVPPPLRSDQPLMPQGYETCQEQIRGILAPIVDDRQTRSQVGQRLSQDGKVATSVTCNDHLSVPARLIRLLRWTAPYAGQRHKCKFFRKMAPFCRLIVTRPRYGMRESRGRRHHSGRFCVRVLLAAGCSECALDATVCKKGAMEAEIELVCDAVSD